MIDRSVFSIRQQAAALLFSAATVLPVSSLAADQVSVGGKIFVNQGLVAVGRIPANQRDAEGETFGSGSGVAIDPTSWTRDGSTYKGTLYLLPDRGYNVEGTTDYRARLNKIAIEITPVAPGATPPKGQEQRGVTSELEGLILFKDDKGQPLTGLDPVAERAAQGALPILPQAGNGKISLDAEAVVRLPDGTLFVGDEYGPYIYRFDATGKLLAATQPPQAFLPIRKGRVNFSSNNPGNGQPAPDPKDPDFGRQNNQGLEGLSLTPDGKYLIGLLQSALRQDGGDSPSSRFTTRALVYDATDPAKLKLVHEYAVLLPTFQTKDKTAVAAQSEILALSDTQFLMLSRDSNNGQGGKGDTSKYRKIELVDLSGATDIAGTAFDGEKPLAPKGVLDAAVTPGKWADFIDINDNKELNRFALHNGAPQDKNNLSEKWESMAIASVLDPAAPDDYFLVLGNDNDFLTQDGHQADADYKAADGAEVDTMFQIYRVTLPGVRQK